MPNTDFSTNYRLIPIAFVLLLSLSGAACGSDIGSDQRGIDAQGFKDAGNIGDAEDFNDAGDALDFDSETRGDAADPDADAAPNLPPRPWPVTEPGPYRVGYTEREITYDARGADEPRTLRLALWFPTLDTEGRTARYFNLFNREEAFAEASVAVDEPAPLLVFSHGNASMAEQSYFMTEFFASHGWIVAAPDHTGNTFLDTEGAINLTSAVFRPQDVSAVLDFVLNLDATDPLAGLVSQDRIVLSGHSFGGFTTLASAGAAFAVDELAADCLESPDGFCEILSGNPEWSNIFRGGFLDERIKVAIPQAPGGYQAFLGGLAEIDIPTLLFTGGMDNTLPPREEGDPIWANMRGSQHLRVDILKAGHFTFSNMCDVLGGSIDILKNDGCSPDFIAPELGYEIINAYSLSFARQVLFGDESTRDLLSGEVTPYAGIIELSRKDEP
jgi:predicted dienelactone hydrolase